MVVPPPPGAAVLYIRGTRSRPHPRANPRKRRAESTQMASVAPPARIWVDSPGGSRATFAVPPPPPPPRHAPPPPWNDHFRQFRVGRGAPALTRGSQAGCANNRMLGLQVSSRRSDAYRMKQKRLHIPYMGCPATDYQVSMKQTASMAHIQRQYENTIWAL